MWSLHPTGNRCDPQRFGSSNLPLSVMNNMPTNLTEAHKEIERLRVSHESLLDMKAEATQLLREVAEWKEIARQCDIRTCQEKAHRQRLQERLGE